MHFGEDDYGPEKSIIWVFRKNLTKVNGTFSSLWSLAQIVPSVSLYTEKNY